MQNAFRPRFEHCQSDKGADFRMTIACNLLGGNDTAGPAHVLRSLDRSRFRPSRQPNRATTASASRGDRRFSHTSRRPWRFGTTRCRPWRMAWTVARATSSGRYAPFTATAYATLAPPRVNRRIRSASSPGLAIEHIDALARQLPLAKLAEPNQGKFACAVFRVVRDAAMARGSTPR